MSEIEPDMLNWEQIFEGAGWFHWTGITPAISYGAALACKKAIEVANKKGVIVSCDLNYRKNLWKYGKNASDIMPELVGGCDVILGNEEDADNIFNIKPQNVDVSKGKVDKKAYEQVTGELMRRFPRSKKIIITLRSSFNADNNLWSGVLWNGKTLFEAPNYEITHIVDRVGSGDSFMAGIIFGFYTYPDDDQKALDFAAAASCLKHTIHGDFNLVSATEVQQLMKGDGSGRVVR